MTVTLYEVYVCLIVWILVPGSCTLVCFMLSRHLSITSCTLVIQEVLCQSHLRKTMMVSNQKKEKDIIELPPEITICHFSSSKIHHAWNFRVWDCPTTRHSSGKRSYFLYFVFALSVKEWHKHVYTVPIGTALLRDKSLNSLWEFFVTKQWCPLWNGTPFHCPLYSRTQVLLLVPKFFCSNSFCWYRYPVII